MTDMTSRQRRTEIERLLIEELAAAGQLERDKGEVTGRWLALVAYHSTDDVGDDDGGVMVVHSDPEPCARDQVAMIEYRRMMINAYLLKSVISGGE